MTSSMIGRRLIGVSSGATRARISVSAYFWLARLCLSVWVGVVAQSGSLVFLVGGVRGFIVEEKVRTSLLCNSRGRATLDASRRY